ncbi:glycosyltransferase [Acetobacterium wieringae]|uniref:Glycosyltransferase n=1 Tax=Acetobacterium wieringae TaxID=52694 RepID=A0A5D0WIF3_9FIRM|nr:glycosyltransferase [Acetobacterium wieringae]TYC82199.1 glycosyltransferase [Acetobacterium wieringae]
MAKYFFIAVNYNGSKFTKEYIKSINAMTTDNDDHLEIIIVDNDSCEIDKKNLLAIEKQFSNLKVLWSTKNLGYFKGLNKGLESVEKDEDIILIVGNNDLTFDEKFLVNYKKIEYSNEVHVIAPNIITKEGRQQNPHVIKSVPKIEKIKASIYNSNYFVGQTMRFINQKIKKIRNKPVHLKNNYGQMKIKRGIGACYILTPHFFKYFTKLDDRVFMWGEEALLSNQIESVGGSILYDPSIIIIHHESASVKSIQSKKKYFMVRESYKIYKKYL